MPQAKGFFAILGTTFAITTAPSAVLAFAGPICPITGLPKQDVVRLAQYVTKQNQTPLMTTEAIIEADKKKGIKPLGNVIQPSRVNCSSLEYDFPEMTSNPGEAIYLGLPKEFQGRNLTMANLYHRNDRPKCVAGYFGEDCPPARTSFDVFTHSNPARPGGEWRTYNNPSGGRGKFAEYRGPDMPEDEVLYGWYTKSSHSSEDGSNDRFIIKPHTVRLLGTGKHPALVSGAKIIFEPPKATEFITHTFTPGTQIGDPFGRGEKFGGGQEVPDNVPRGTFPNALALIPSQLSQFQVRQRMQGPNAPYEAPQLPAGWKVQGGQLLIPLPPGKKITSVEVAAGDSRPDGKTNSDQGTGTSGWARLNIQLVRKDGKTDTLVKDDNVPPQGVIGGSPTDCNYQTQQGDYISIRTDAGTKLDIAYIMGVKIGMTK